MEHRRVFSRRSEVLSSCCDMVRVGGWCGAFSFFFLFFFLIIFLTLDVFMLFCYFIKYLLRRRKRIKNHFY